MISYDDHKTQTSVDIRTAPADIPVEAFLHIGVELLPVGEIVRTEPPGPRTHPYYPEGLGPSYDAPRQGRTDLIPNPSRWTVYKAGVKQSEFGTWSSALSFFVVYDTPEPTS